MVEKKGRGPNIPPKLNGDVDTLKRALKKSVREVARLIRAECHDEAVSLVKRLGPITKWIKDMESLCEHSSSGAIGPQSREEADAICAEIESQLLRLEESAELNSLCQTVEPETEDRIF